MRHGIPPDTPLEVYRGGVLALRVRTVGEGAQLEVRDNRYGTPVCRRASAGALSAPPIAPNGVPFPYTPLPKITRPTVVRPGANGLA